MKMKNKGAVQFEAKQKHIADLKAAKQRRSVEPTFERVASVKLVKPTILIVCEGEKTEPSYFRHFKLVTAKIKAIGKGYNTVSLVNQATVLSEERTYDQVWCVFDKDHFPANDFNDAITIAEANNFSVAYSNQAFEYWLILHFEDHQGGGMNRNEYNQTINKYINPLGANYDGKGSKIITEDFFEILDGIDTKTNKPRTELAILRSKRNYNLLTHTSPATEESSTTVFRLVEEILKYT